MDWHKESISLKRRLKRLNSLLPKDKQVYWDVISTQQLKLVSTNMPVFSTNVIEQLNLITLGMISALELMEIK